MKDEGEKMFCLHAIICLRNCEHTLLVRQITWSITVYCPFCLARTFFCPLLKFTLALFLTSIFSCTLTCMPDFFKCDYRESFMSCSSRCKSAKAIGEHALSRALRPLEARALALHGGFISTAQRSRNLHRSALIYYPACSRSHITVKQFAG